MLKAGLIISLAVVISAKNEENKDGLFSWSNLSYQSSNSESSDDMVGSESEVYTQEVLPDIDTSSPEGRANPRLRRRKNRFRNRRPVYNSLDYVNNQIADNDYIDRDSGYSAPSSSYNPPSSSYTAPETSYDAPSYSAPAYEAPSYSAPSYSGGKDTFNDFLNALAAFLPIGLFLAAIPPNLIVINSTRRKRGVEAEVDSNNLDTDYSFPFMKKIGVLGYDGLQSVNCQRRLVCEMATYGAYEGANSVQKGLAYIATLTPRPVAQYLNADDVFQAVRNERCEQFHCPAAF